MDTCLGDKPERIGPLATPLVRFGVPLSLMGLLLKGGWNTSLLSMAALTATVIMVLRLVLRGWSQRLNQLMSLTLQLGTCIGKTAYLGIPDTAT